MSALKAQGLPPAAARARLARLPALLVAALALLCTPRIRAAVECAEDLIYESRDDVPLRFRWDPADVFQDKEEFDVAVAAAEAAIPEIGAWKGRLGSSTEDLVSALNASYELSRSVGEIYFFAKIQLDVNSTDPGAAAMVGVASSLAARADEASSFVGPEIAALPRARLDALLEEPSMAPYRHVIENVNRTKAHIRSPEVELVLAGASQLARGPQDISNHLLNSDIVWPTVVGTNGEDVQVTPATYGRISRSPDREFRRVGRAALLRTYEAFGNTLSASLATHVQGQAWVSRVTRYNSSLERALDGANVPVRVVRSLVDAVHGNFGAVHNYTALRKRALGVETLYAHDSAVDLVPNDDKRYCFEDAWTMAMAFWREVFGEEYASVAETAFANRWIDVFPNTGKRGGAYAWVAYGNHPYMLLNWAGTFGDVATLVHEMGHVVHMNLTHTNQPFHYSSPSVFVQEVASVTSENLFIDWAIGRSEDPKERAVMLNAAVRLAEGAFITQTLFHEFEEAIYSDAENGRPLTKETMGAAFLDLITAYYGPDITFNASDSVTFLRVPHFYFNYYVWVYATSYAAGEAIASRFRSGDQGVVDDFLSMLKLGSSVYPLDVVRAAGVDLLDPSVVGAVMSRFQNLTESLEMELDMVSDGKSVVTAGADAEGTASMAVPLLLLLALPFITYL
ncbi:unnamed protein product [Ostreobium quekettii]|uniref:Oligoendopeptidase F n=1 Tax=Ostreobium quekettii TaxID=121088 RepID=A0A8S1J875_9CHLO|nr:unnamed protein product [Ostreobium quekettii]